VDPRLPMDRSPAADPCWMGHETAAAPRGRGLCLERHGPC
jgi:hypothetical protein